MHSHSEAAAAEQPSRERQPRRARAAARPGRGGELGPLHACGHGVHHDERGEGAGEAQHVGDVQPENGDGGGRAEHNRVEAEDGERA